MDGAWSVPVSVRLAVANWPVDAGHGAVAEFCRTHGISRSWFYALRARARGDGPVSVVKPRSRRPRSSPSRIDPALEQVALQLRADLLADGWDGGPISVRQAMLDAGIAAPSRASLARIFARAGVVTPSPNKRPISSRRFTYPAPNECWQLDGFDHVLANGARACVLQVIDDHSRRIVASHAARGETISDVTAVLKAAIAKVGVPQRLLTDNAPALNPTRRGRVGVVETWLRGLGVQPISSSVGHPQTQGKAERHHQTTQRWLSVRDPAPDLPSLQAQLQDFEDAYNNRPHQGISMLTPLQAWAATPVAPPPAPAHTAQARTSSTDGEVLTCAVDSTGQVYINCLRINLGMPHAHTQVLATTAGPHIVIWDRDGLHLRTIETSPGKTYYGVTRRAPRRPRNP